MRNEEFDESEEMDMMTGFSIDLQLALMEVMFKSICWHKVTSRLKVAQDREK